MSHLHRLRAHTLIYLHSINNKVKPPRPSTQLQSHPWTILAQCSLDNCRPMAGSEATLRKTLGRGDRQPPCPSVIQQLSTQRTALYITSLQTNNTALSTVPIMLQPIYTLQYNVTAYVTPIRANATAYLLPPYNLRVQPISRLIIQEYSLYIKSSQSNATAYILRPNSLRLHPLYYVPTN